MTSRKTQLQFLLLLITGTLFLSFFILRPFLLTLAMAIVFAVILQPAYKKILRYFKNYESLAALATIVVSIVCILIPGIFLGTKIFSEAVQLYNTITQGDNTQNMIITTLRSIGQTFDNFIPGTGNYFINISNNVDVYLKQGLTWIINNLGTALSSISTLFLDLFIFFISIYYLLRDVTKLKRAIIKISPFNDEYNEVVFERLESAINSVIRGSLLIAVIQGILTTIGFTFFGIPNSVLWGMLTVIAALVPGIGTSLVIIPGIIYLFVIGNTVPAIGLLIWGTTAVGLIDNILGPKVIGKKLKIHPLFILLSVLGGLSFFGPAGIFLGPLTTSLLFAFIETYSSFTNDTEKTK